MLRPIYPLRLRTRWKLSFRALRDVAEAQKGVGRIAALAGVNRENLYRMLSQKGNPRLDSLLPVLKALDFSLVVETNEGASPKRG